MNSKPTAFFSICQLLFVTLVSIFYLGLGLPIAAISLRMNYLIYRQWARTVARIFAVQIEVKDENQGKYSNEGLLFVTLNQTSLSETFIGSMTLPVPTRLIMNARMAMYPLVGWTTALHAVILILPWKEQSKRAMQRAVALLRTSNFWISVEGRRSYDGKLSPYKKGSAILAIQAQAGIVPIVFHGAREVLPYGDWQVRPGKVLVEIKRIISTQSLSLEQKDQLTQQLWDIAIQSGCKT